MAAIEALISLGCEVVVPDAVGSTPIHVAAGEGHLEAVQELVRLGCSPQGAPAVMRVDFQPLFQLFLPIRKLVLCQFRLCLE